MSATGLPLTRETDPDWYRDHENLAALWRDLEDRGETIDAGYFMEKPWRWTAEWVRFCRTPVAV